MRKFKDVQIYYDAAYVQCSLIQNLKDEQKLNLQKKIIRDFSKNKK